ncbi:MAG: AAA family ATPase [Hyphomonadaceae bacterium]
MSAYPYFARGLSGAASTRAEEIPTLDRSQVEAPEAYLPHPDLSHAVNVALITGMPLLLTGEPGTGKTQLAYALAHELNCHVLKFETKSTSQARDLFYTYDALSAFKVRDAADPRQFIQYQALGQAILEAFPGDNPRLARLLPAGAPHAGPRRAVVLIDEIDKAPRDFPNDLLNEIDRLFFRVPELQNAGSPGAEPNEEGVAQRYRPIVILTSNSEKGLPDPFLRRCVYFDIPFPTSEELANIVAARVAGVRSTDPLVGDALDLFQKLRGGDRSLSLKKKPSTAELLNWIQMLLHRGVNPGQRLVTQKPLVLQTLSTLVKNSDDRREATAFIQDRWGA